MSRGKAGFPKTPSRLVFSISDENPYVVLYFFGMSLHHFRPLHYVRVKAVDVFAPAGGRKVRDLSVLDVETRGVAFSPEAEVGSVSARSHGFGQKDEENRPGFPTSAEKLQGVSQKVEKPRGRFPLGREKIRQPEARAFPRRTNPPIRLSACGFS